MKFNVGDKARVLRAACGAPDSTIGNVYEVAEISGPGDNGVGLRVPGATGRNGLWWWHITSDLELITDHKCACILTEKVLVGNTPCRKIVGFEGILGREELPRKYLGGSPSFYQDKTAASHYEFDGRVRWIPADGETIGVSYRIPSHPDPEIVLDTFPMHMLTIGDIYSEAAFQNILVWLKRAGARLAKIRTHEKAAWSGKEAIEI